MRMSPDLALIAMQAPGETELEGMAEFFLPRADSTPAHVTS